MIEEMYNSERKFVSDLISIINEFRGLSYIKGLLSMVDEAYHQKSIDDEFVQQRCARLNEQLADAKMHYGQKIITQEQLIIDVRQAISVYRDAKSVDTREPRLRCSTGPK